MNINLNSESKALIKNSALTIMASYIGGAILFLANALLAIRFGPRDFGIFKTIINFFCFLPVLIDLGITATFAKYIAQYPQEKTKIIIRGFLRFSFYLYLASAIILVIFRRQFALYFLKDPLLYYLAYAGILLFLFFYFEILKSIIQGFQQFKLYAFSQFLTLGFAGVFTFILGYYFGIFFAVLGWGLGYLIGNIVNVRFLLKKRVFQKPYIDINLKEIFLGYSLPIYLTTMPGFVGLAVIPILSLFFHPRLIGYLAFSMIFYQGAIAIPMALSTILFPKFSELSVLPQQSRILFKQSFYIYTPVVITGVLLCLLLSRPFLKFLFPAYLPGLLVFISMVCFALISGYFIIYKIYLAASSRFKLLAFVSIIHNFGLLIISFISLNFLS